MCSYLYCLSHICLQVTKTQIKLHEAEEGILPKDSGVSQDSQEQEHGSTWEILDPGTRIPWEPYLSHFLSPAQVAEEMAGNNSQGLS